ncbi:MAG: hypothetical protein M3Y07_00195 [Acidobacteriota bacterium]|nr:hypothetical protein [Acidobacteriota bacterium]
MKLAGLLLLTAGWIIVLAAMTILKSPDSRAIFPIAGFGVELLGLVLAARGHLPVRETGR